MINDDILKKLPYSLEAEQSVLGSILISPDTINDAINIISVNDFYLEEHQHIFSAMQTLYKQNKQIDPVLLCDALVSENVYNIDESKRYIRTIIEIVPTSSHIKDYAQIIRDKSLLRQLISVCSDISETAYSEQENAQSILDYAEGKIFNLAQNNESSDFGHIRNIIIDIYSHLNALKENKDEATGVPTGFSGVDDMLIGMGKSDLILIGARPGMGKTSFAMNIATNVARHSEKTVCIFSLEMSKQQLVQRMLASEALVDSMKLRSGNLDNDDWAKLAEASSFLSKCDILIDDTTGISVMGMKAKLRRIKNLGLVVIDYLQLMQGDKRTDNRVQEVSDISRNLKILAKELQVPVICCAQLNRGPESRTDKRPMLSDLRESGSIEQDADTIIFISRDYYMDNPENQNKAELIVAKNRHGSTGKTEVGWHAQYTRFSTLDTQNEP